MSKGCSHGHTSPCTECFRDARIATLERSLAGVTAERDALNLSVDFWHGVVRTFWRFAGVDDAPEGSPWKVNETNGRLLKLRQERDDARAQVSAAQAAVGNGADDARWRPGETAVDALIRERDEALEVAACDPNDLRATIVRHRAKNNAMAAERDAMRKERDEARALLAEARFYLSGNWAANSLRSRIDALLGRG